MSSGQASPILGIDLGTTMSLACVYHDSRLQMVLTDPILKKYELPSIVANSKGGAVVGYAAKEQFKDLVYGDSVVRYPKSKMGEDYKYDFGERTLTPTQASGIILSHIREAAQAQFAFDFNKAAITVPANFGEFERRRTVEAAVQAGFDPSGVHLLDEPLAAALGLSLHRSKKQELCIVFDLGGGTLDVTLLLTQPETQELLEYGREGHKTLGGNQWDRLLARQVVWEGDKHRGTDRIVPDDFFDTSNYHLHDEVNKLKHDLCRGDAAAVAGVRYHDTDLNQTVDSRVSRDRFFQRTEYLSEACARVCQMLLDNIHQDDFKEIRKKRFRGVDFVRWGYWTDELWRKGLDWDQIDNVYLVGGGSNVPAVRNAIEQRLKKTPILCERPQDQIARGAAVYAENIREGKTMRLKTRCPHTTGYFEKGTEGKETPPNELPFHPLIRRNRKVPYTRKHTIPIEGTGNVFRIHIGQERREVSLEQEGKIVITREVVDKDKNSANQGLVVKLRPRKPNEKDELTIYVTYKQNQPLTFRMEVRGQKNIKWESGE